MSADRGIRPGRCVVVAVPATSGTSLFHQLLGHRGGTVGTDAAIVVVGSVRCDGMAFGAAATDVVVVACDFPYCWSDVRLVEEHELVWRKKALYDRVSVDVNR